MKKEERKEGREGGRESDVPLRLLLEVLLASVGDLLHHAYIVLRRRTNASCQLARLLVNRIARCATCQEELRCELIQLRETASLWMC